VNGEFQLTIDAERCVGVGQCELLEPDLFRLNDDTGTTILIGTPKLPRDRAHQVVDQCPSGAIQLAPES
jgi:ferredoxin